uniref:Uncharacterized protein n=1 Tax=Fagus sylvatica TaxID=28930 RepID=A0A2N9FX93_FAGSY
MGHAAYRQKALDVYFPTIPVKWGKPPANRELHVVAGSRHLSNASGLAGQLAASQERLCARRRLFGEKNVSNLRLIFPCFLFVFARILDLAPDVGFRRSWYHRKACATLFLKVLGSQETELGSWRNMVLRAGAAGLFLVHRRAFFRSKILARPGKILTIREFHVVHECVLFLTYPGLWINLFFVHNSLVSRPFFTRKVSNRSSHHALHNGQGAVSPIQPSVWSTVQSNLGQTWSTPVKLGQLRSNLVNSGQNSPNSRKCIPNCVLRVFKYSGPQSGHKWLRSNLGQTWSTSVKLDALALNRLTHGSKVKVGFRFLVFSQNSTFPTSVFSFPSSSNLALRKSVRPSEMSHRGSGSGDHRRSSRLGFFSPFLFVADGGTPCGPFLRDFGFVRFRRYASSIEVVVALSAGSECTCIPYFSVPWDPSVRHLLVVLIFLGFQAESGLQDWFLTVKFASRFPGHPVDGKPSLIVLHQTPPMKTALIQFFGLRAGFRSFGSMASSSGNSDSLVTLRFHDFCAERMRHWWTLLGEDDHASIMRVSGMFPSLMRLQVDLVPTLEEYAGLLQLDSPFSETPVIPIYGPRGACKGLHCRQEGVEEILNQRLQDRLCRSIIPAILCETVRSLSYYRRQGEGVPMFCIQLLQLWFCSHLQYFYRLQTPHHFERHTVRQTVDTALPFTGNSRDCALYLLDLSLGYYPSLALHQFGGIQYPPRLGDLSSVTFDYVPEGGLHADSSVTPDFAEWREGWSPSFTLRPTVRPDVSHASVPPSLQASTFAGQSERIAVLERELEEARAELASLRLVKASEREESAARVESMRSTLHHSNAAVANLPRDLEVQRGNVSTLRAMNDFIREQLEISKAAKDHLEQTLAETQGQLKTEQVERTQVQDELDSLHSYTQALVDPSTGRPHDIVALRRALDESEATLTSARTSIGAMRGFPVVTALHQVNQVMDSLGARARAVLQEHDEGDPALYTALGRFCRETCIRLGH